MDFQKTSTGASNQVRIFTEGIKELGATLGENLLPLITPIIQKLNEWVQKFGQMDEGTQKLVLALGGLVIILPPIIGGIGSLCTGISAIIGLFATKTVVVTADTLATNGAITSTGAWTVANTGLTISLFGITVPLWVIIGIIGLLIGVGYLLVKNWDWICEKAGAIWSSITGFFQEFNDFMNGIFTTDFSQAFGYLGEILNGFFDNFKDIYDGIKLIFTGIIDFITGVFTGDWEKALNGVKDVMLGIMNTIAGLIKAPINAMIQGLNWLIGGINSALSFEIPDWVPLAGGKSFSLDIPQIGYLENGGLLTQPTMLGNGFMAGEKDKGRTSQSEVVVPLDRLFNEFAKIFNRDNVVQIDGREFMRVIAPYSEEIEKYRQQFAYL